ncbi:hypothetical protein [Streptomyces sp. NPDC051704]|uniref:hypothetical protein n=1 Tax=Streptomyces sp. NPDC051704 TaxID=3365671 RepID=UPI0037BD7902
MEARQRWAATRGRTATALTAKTPTFIIAFDALQSDGIEPLALPYAERHRGLEALVVARPLTTRWTLCTMTTDPDKARERLEDWTDGSGVEGLLQPEFGVDRLTMMLRVCSSTCHDRLCPRALRRAGRIL